MYRRPSRGFVPPSGLAPVNWMGAQVAMAVVDDSDSVDASEADSEPVSWPPPGGP